MSSELPFTIADTEPERARLIVASYLDRKYGAVPLSKMEIALSEIFRLYRTGIRQPLLLANKAIDLIESSSGKGPLKQARECQGDLRSG